MRSLAWWTSLPRSDSFPNWSSSPPTSPLVPAHDQIIMSVSLFPLSALAFVSLALGTVPTQSPTAQQSSAQQSRIQLFDARPSGAVPIALGQSVANQIGDPFGAPAAVRWRSASYQTRPDARNITLLRAAKVLEGVGFSAEAERLREVMEIMAADGVADEHARRLLSGDIQDRAIRVEMIKLAADGYRTMGWEANAAGLDWFAAIGSAQVTGEPMESSGMPEAARSKGANVMDRMVELVLGASAAHHSQGHEVAADACMRLGRFYVERSLGAFADAPPVAQPAAGQELKGIGYSGNSDASPDVSSQMGWDAQADSLGLSRDALALKKAEAAVAFERAAIEVRAQGLQRNDIELMLEAHKATQSRLLALRDKMLARRASRKKEADRLKPNADER